MYSMKKWSPDFIDALHASCVVILTVSSIVVVFFITPFLDSLPGNFYYTWCSYRTQQCNEYGIYTGIALLLVATLAILYVRHKKISVPLKFNEKVNYDMTRFEKVLHFILLLMTAIIFVVTVGYLGTIL